MYFPWNDQVRSKGWANAELGRVLTEEYSKKIKVCYSLVSLVEVTYGKWEEFNILDLHADLGQNYSTPKCLEAWHVDGLPCFIFERARAPSNFLLGKGHPMRKFVNFYPSISRARRQSSLLPSWSIRPCSRSWPLWPFLVQACGC